MVSKTFAKFSLKLVKYTLDALGFKSLIPELISTDCVNKKQYKMPKYL